MTIRQRIRDLKLRLAYYGGRSDLLKAKLESEIKALNWVLSENGKDLVNGIDNLPNEKWEYIKNTNNKYMVSNMGRFKSLHGKRPRLMMGSMCKNRLEIVIRDENKKRVRAKAAQIVAEYFDINGIKTDSAVINHINGNPQDNSQKNLEWCSRSYNSSHAVRTYLNNPKHTILTDYEVCQIVSLYLKTDMTAKQIAKIYEVKTKHIEGILSCKSRKNVVIDDYVKYKLGIKPHFNKQRKRVRNKKYCV